MNTRNTQTQGPFSLNPQDYPFLDALLIQCVAGATNLHWETSGGGFFAETEQSPLRQFEAATLITGRGKRVAGFAARTFLFYPIASRTVWTMGEPGNRVRVNGYQDGAKSRTQGLAMLEDGRWVVITSRGLASQSLSNAFRDHCYKAIKRYKAQPFVMPMSGVAGEAQPIGSTMVTPFQFVTLDERCPDDLGWKIRERWTEVETWLNKTTNGDDPDDNTDGNGYPEQRQEAPQQPEPASTPEADVPEADPVLDNGHNGKNVPVPSDSKDWTTFWEKTIPALNISSEDAQAAVNDSGKDAVAAYKALIGGDGAV